LRRDGNKKQQASGHKLFAVYKSTVNRNKNLRENRKERKMEDNKASAWVASNSKNARLE
jgi:hypothetical protein